VIGVERIEVGEEARLLGEERRKVCEDARLVGADLRNERYKKEKGL
jgi:hypothetical protein